MTLAQRAAEGIRMSKIGLLLVGSYGIWNPNVGEVKSQAAICEHSQWCHLTGLISNDTASGVDRPLLCSALVVFCSAHVRKIELVGKRCVRRI